MFCRELLVVMLLVAETTQIIIEVDSEMLEYALDEVLRVVYTECECGTDSMRDKLLDALPELRCTVGGVDASLDDYPDWVPDF